MRTTAIFAAVVLAAATLTVGALNYGPRLLSLPTGAEASAVVWPEASAERTIPRPADPVKRISIVAVGDCMVHTPQLASAKTGSGYDFAPVFAPVQSRIAKADLAIANLETVLDGASSGYTGYPTFNSPDSYAEALLGAGFDVLTNANNHTLDRGPDGITQTLDTLDRLGALHTGTARTPDEASRVLITEVDGVKVAVLAYTYGMNGFQPPEGKSWMVNTINQQAMSTKVAEARGLGADIVIVSIHNGVEYQRQPSDSQVAVERAMIAAGADVVLGSHPHVIQPMEMVPATRADGSPRTGFIIHSLGNFMSNQRERFRDTGLILQLDFEKNLKTGVTTLFSVAYVPVWVDDTIATGAGHRALPMGDVIADTAYPGVNGTDREKVQQAWGDTLSHLGGTQAVSGDTSRIVFYQAERG